MNLPRWYNILSDKWYKSVNLQVQHPKSCYKFFYAMHNDPALHGPYLGKITTDFARVAERLQETSYLMRQRGYAYPIFPAAPAAIRLGALLVGPGELDNQWHYYATYLDALVQCQLVAEDKRPAFKSIYKDPDEFSCLLVVDQGSANFIYIPYPID